MVIVPVKAGLTPIVWDSSAPVTLKLLKDESVRRCVSTHLVSHLTPKRNRWFREVTLCLLTPQTNPIRAESAIEMLEEEGLFAEDRRLTQAKVSKILGLSSHYIRFHNTKAKRVLEILKQRDEVEELLDRKESSYFERKELRKKVNGLGLKEASHALRNIGRRGGLAIFDRHILRNLVSLGVIDKVPTTLTDKLYLELEETYLKFIDRQKLDIDEVDLVLWGNQTGYLYK